MTKTKLIELGSLNPNSLKQRMKQRDLEILKAEVEKDKRRKKQYNKKYGAVILMWCQDGTLFKMSETIDRIHYRKREWGDVNFRRCGSLSISDCKEDIDGVVEYLANKYPSHRLIGGQKCKKTI